MKKISAMTEFFNTSNTADFLPPRKLSQNDCVKIGKCEEDLENILKHFSSLLANLYIKTEGENFAHVDTHGEFVNLLDLCLEEGDGVFEFVTNWIYPDEIYIDISDGQKWIFEKYPEAFKKIHFWENRREEILNQREELLREY